MDTYIMNQLELLLRLVVAGACGLAVGYERKNRLKEAGIRTHMIVAIGSALIMIVSKYGFNDILALPGYALDPSRIAAQIVSGIGFLGAGMIFVRKQAINGLTTAAGIWTIAGVGMAIGAKLYLMGIVSTLLIVFVHTIIYQNYKWLHIPIMELIILVFDDSREAISFVQEKFSTARIEIIGIKADRKADRVFEVELNVKLPDGYDRGRLLNLFKDNPHVISVEY